MSFKKAAAKAKCNSASKSTSGNSGGSKFKKAAAKAKKSCKGC